MAFCEVSQDQSPGTPAAAGDFGFKVLTSSDPAEKTKKLSAELANGRLAMMAIIGMFFQVGGYLSTQTSRDVCLPLSVTLLLSSCLVVASAKIPMSLQLCVLSYADCGYVFTGRSDRQRLG